MSDYDRAVASFLDQYLVRPYEYEALRLGEFDYISNSKTSDFLVSALTNGHPVTQGQIVNAADVRYFVQEIVPRIRPEHYLVRVDLEAPEDTISLVVLPGSGKLVIVQSSPGLYDPKTELVTAQDLSKRLARLLLGDVAEFFHYRLERMETPLQRRREATGNPALKPSLVEVARVLSSGQQVLPEGWDLTYIVYSLRPIDNRGRFFTLPDLNRMNRDERAGLEELYAIIQDINDGRDEFEILPGW